MSDEILNEYTGELVPVTRTTSRVVDMRDRATDSWTDVLGDVGTLARGIAATEFVPKGLRCQCGKPQGCTCGGVAKTSAAVLYARELGLSPMTGLGGTHVIEGKAGISAELMRALVLQAGHELAIKKSDRTVCEIWGRRRGTTEWTTSTWTIAEAQQTKVFISKEKGWQPLSSKSTWQSWPTEMLLARATTRLVRMIFPDVAHGMRTVEELQDMQTTEEVVEAELVEPPTPAAPLSRRRVSPSKRAADVPSTPAEPVEVAPAEAGTAEPEVSPAPIARARVGRPAPRGAVPEPVATPAPDPEPVAEVGTLPEVVDAEVVEDLPARVTDDPKARKNAGTVVIMHWQRLGVTDRAERIWYSGVLTGREIKSTNDLTLAELRTLVATLERVKDLDAVEALIKERSGHAK